MHLYHVLSKERLQDKVAHAEAHGGELLLTGHAPAVDSAEGALDAYIHLLPNLVGGIDFSRRHEVAAIRVTVDPARVHRLAGSRDDLDLAAAAREAGVLHVLWQEPGLWFQEWLLSDPAAVTAWTADPDVLRDDFFAQLAALREGRLGPSEWFYPDMALDAQVGMAELIGARLGYLEVPDPADRREAYRRACYRLGLERADPTKCLFYVGPPFLQLARALAGRPWRPELPLAVVEGSAPWHGLDEAITEAAGVLAGAVDAAAGPLEVEVAGPSDALRFAVGVRVDAGAALPEGVRGVPPPDLGQRVEHTGRLWDLPVSSERVRYVLHRFEGARSEHNEVTVVS